MKQRKKERQREVDLLFDTSDDLLLRHNLFIENYLECLNGTLAWQLTHPEASYDVASQSASRLLRNVKIKAELEKRFTDKIMSKKEVLTRLNDQANATLLPFVKIDEEGYVYFNFKDKEAKKHFHLIKKVKHRKLESMNEKTGDFKQENWVEVELHDPQRALELIGKYYVLFTDKPEPTNDANTKFTLPAEMIAPSFSSSHRAILSGKYYEFNEYGGRGSTKSSFTSEEIITLLKNNPNGHALAMRQVADTLRGSVFSQFERSINLLGLSSEFKMTTNPMEITYLPTGQKIFFRGADDPNKIKSLSVPFGSIIALWLEELPEFRGEEAIRNIKQSAIRGTDKAYIFQTWNPSRTSANWVNKYILIPKEKQWNHKSDYRDVPTEWLGRIFIEEAEHLKNTNPAAYDHEYLGEVNGLGDQIFENLEIRKITDKEISNFDNIMDGIDFGYYPHPAHYCKVHYDADRLILYVYVEVRKWKASNSAMYKAIKKAGYRDSDLLIGDSAEPKSIGDYAAYNANIRGAEKGQDSVAYSIKWLQSLVKIVIDPVRCPYTTEELTDYAYERTKNGEIIEAYPREKDDALASIRYATNLIWRRKGE